MPACGLPRHEHLHNFLHVELERSVRYDNRMRCSDGFQQMSGASMARKAAPTDCGRCSVLRSESACTRTRRVPQRFPPTSRRPDQEKRADLRQHTGLVRPHQIVAASRVRTTDEEPCLCSWSRTS